jgi:DNA-directed RNA polymerase subunit beta'
VGGVAGSASVESALTANLMVLFSSMVAYSYYRKYRRQKVRTVIGRTGEVRIMDLKNDRLLITNNIPYGSTLA